MACAARILLVHLASNDDVSMCKNLVEALSNFFSLICSLSESSIPPSMGIIVVGDSRTEVSMKSKLIKEFLVNSNKKD